MGFFSSVEIVLYKLLGGGMYMKIEMRYIVKMIVRKEMCIESVMFKIREVYINWFVIEFIGGIGEKWGERFVSDMMWEEGWRCENWCWGEILF